MSHLAQTIYPDDLVNGIVSAVVLKKLSFRDYDSWKTWIWDRKPLLREETTFTKYGDDLVSLSTGQEPGWFDRMVEDMLEYLPRRFTQVLSTS